MSSQLTDHADFVLRLHSEGATWVEIARRLKPHGVEITGQGISVWYYRRLKRGEKNRARAGLLATTDRLEASSQTLPHQTEVATATSSAKPAQQVGNSRSSSSAIANASHQRVATGAAPLVTPPALRRDQKAAVRVGPQIDIRNIIHTDDDDLDVVLGNGAPSGKPPG